MNIANNKPGVIHPRVGMWFTWRGRGPYMIDSLIHYNEMICHPKEMISVLASEATKPLLWGTMDSWYEELENGRIMVLPGDLQPRVGMWVEWTQFDVDSSLRGPRKIVAITHGGVFASLPAGGDSRMVEETEFADYVRKGLIRIILDDEPCVAAAAPPFVIETAKVLTLLDERIAAHQKAMGEAAATSAYGIAERHQTLTVELEKIRDEMVKLDRVRNGGGKTTQA